MARIAALIGRGREGQAETTAARSGSSAEVFAALFFSTFVFPGESALLRVLPGEGVGKSTLAVHLAVWLFDRGYKTALLDADKQRSSSQWIGEAEAGVTVRTADTPEMCLSEAQELARSPVGATTFKIRVTNPSGTATSAGSFTVTAGSATPSASAVDGLLRLDLDWNSSGTQVGALRRRKA